MNKFSNFKCKYEIKGFPVVRDFETLVNAVYTETNAFSELKVLPSRKLFMLEIR